MNWRKHMVLIVGGAICLLLVGFATFMLVRYMGHYNKVTAELTAESEKLDRLNRRDPYPSQENVAIISKNTETLDQYLVNIQNTLQRDQIEPQKIEPAEFAALLERGVREVRSSVGSTKIPDRMSLGFDRYAQGELPKLDAIPRLVIQLKTIKALINVMIAAKVDQVVDIQREIFERDASAPEEEAAPVDRRFASASEGGGESSPAPTLPPPEVNELFTPERIILIFKASEHSAWEVLNALARSKMFAVVNHVEILNDAEIVVQPPTAADAAAGGQPGSAPITVFKSHEDRIAGGREPVKVTLAVDVYRFAVAAPAEAAP